MYNYSWIEWLFVFFFYCFFGWCFESTYVSIRQHRFVNRGFIRGPFLPLYGSGAVVLLLAAAPVELAAESHHWHWYLTYLVMFMTGMIGATVLEYVTGVCMEKLFKVRYWDYSDQKLNFQGQICLSSSLAWGGLTILVTQLIHRLVENVLFALPSVLVGVIAIGTAIYFIADFTLAFKAALDLRDVLIKIENARRELANMQKRLDVLVAVAGDDLMKERAHIGEEVSGAGRKLDDWRKGIALRLDALKDQALNNELGDKTREEWLDIRTRFFSLVQRGEEPKRSGIEHRTRKILKGNPYMTSAKYKEALEELKNHVLIGKKEKNIPALEDAERKESSSAEKSCGTKHTTDTAETTQKQK